MPIGGHDQTDKIKTYLAGVFASKTRNDIM